MRHAILPILVTVAALAALARGAETSPAPIPPVIPPADPFPEVPDGQGGLGRFQVLRGDFHMHTTLSDGKLTVRERVLEARAYGLDVIAITDHRHFKGFEESAAVGEECGLLVLRGMETGLKDREHIVMLDFAAGYTPCDEHSWADASGAPTVYYREQWPKLTDAGAFSILAHPHMGLDPQGKWIAETGERMDLQHALREPLRWGIENRMLHGIEVACMAVDTESWGTRLDHGTFWYPVALDWAVEHKLTVIANSDAHPARGHYATLSKPTATLLLARERSTAGAMEALRSGRTVASFGDLLAGRPEMVSLLLSGITRVTYVKRGGGAVATLHNRGPLLLRVTPRLPGAEPLELPPGRKVELPVENPPAALVLEWTNVRVSSRAAFTSTHALTP